MYMSTTISLSGNRMPGVGWRLLGYMEFEFTAREMCQLNQVMMAPLSVSNAVAVDGLEDDAIEGGGTAMK